MNQEGIDIEYSIERKEYLSFFLLEAYKTKTMKIIVLLGVLLLGVSFYHLQGLKLGEFFPVSLTISFGLSSSVVAPFLVVWLGLKKYNVHPDLHETRKLTIDPDSIVVTGQTFKHIIPTASIDQMLESRKFYYLTGQKKILLIARKCLTEIDEQKINSYFKKLS